MGEEHLTKRVEILIRVMQYTSRISTLVHFGKPCVLGELPHIPYYILGGLSAESIDACLTGTSSNPTNSSNIRLYNTKERSRRSLFFV